VVRVRVARSSRVYAEGEARSYVSLGRIARASRRGAGDDIGVARHVERCRDCTPGTMCRWHLECQAHRDARIAADIGVGWARFVWLAIDVRRPWPACHGRCAAIATRLVSWLVKDNEQERGRQLAEICCWRASITWEALQAGSRDRPFRPPSDGGIEYALPGRDHVVIRFRPRRRATVVPLARSALATMRERAGRFRVAQGLHGDEHGSQGPAGAPSRRSTYVGRR
jgi:hypothetical protein